MPQGEKPVVKGNDRTLIFQSGDDLFYLSRGKKYLYLKGTYRDIDGKIIAKPTEIFEKIEKVNPKVTYKRLDGDLIGRREYRYRIFESRNCVIKIYKLDPGSFLSDEPLYFKKKETKS